MKELKDYETNLSINPFKTQPIISNETEIALRTKKESFKTKDSFSYKDLNENIENLKNINKNLINIIKLKDKELDFIKEKLNRAENQIENYEELIENYFSEKQNLQIPIKEIINKKENEIILNDKNLIELSFDNHNNYVEFEQDNFNLKLYKPELIRLDEKNIEIENIFEITINIVNKDIGLDSININSSECK